MLRYHALSTVHGETRQSHSMLLPALPLPLWRLHLCKDSLVAAPPILQLIAQIDARGAKVRRDPQRGAPERQLALPVLQQRRGRHNYVRPCVAIQQPQSACRPSAPLS